MEKKCTKCGEVKDFAEFTKNKKGKFGLQARCRACMNEISRAYHKANKDAIKARKDLDRKENPEKYADIERRRHKKHKEKRRKKSKDWTAANPEKARVHWRRRSQRKRASKYGCNSETWDRHVIHAEAGGRCLYCGIKIELDEMHADHFIPLVKGGSNLRGNIVCSCASCNLSKHDKMPEDFIGETL